MRKNFGEIFVLVAAGAVYLFFLLGLAAFYPDYPKETSETVDVTAEQGASAFDFALAAEKAGVVTNARGLARELSALGVDRKILPGVYRLHKSNAYIAAREIQKSAPASDKITLIPGARYKDFLALFTGRGKDAKTALNKTENFPAEIREILPQSARARIAFMLPETYFLAKTKDEPNKLVKTASSLWFERIGKHISRADKNIYIKTASLASLVENEAKFDDERPLIAGVLLKRIEKNMPLQCDASVIYAWEEKGIKKTNLTYKDLEIDSPYNTYKNKGLPPAPICVPSQESWFAVLSPKKTECLYYFADKNGRHIFSKTYDEHIRKQKETKH